VPVEAHDEWQVGERRYLFEGSMALLATVIAFSGRRHSCRSGEPGLGGCAALDWRRDEGAC
jgi:hypothetical protein